MVISLHCLRSSEMVCLNSKEVFMDIDVKIKIGKYYFEDKISVDRNSDLSTQELIMLFKPFVDDLDELISMVIEKIRLCDSGVTIKMTIGDISESIGLGCSLVTTRPNAVDIFTTFKAFDLCLRKVFSKF